MRHDAKEFGSWIAGKWRTGGERERRNPSNLDEVVYSYGIVGAPGATEAIGAAVEAHAAWSRMSPQRRADILGTAGTELRADAAQIGRLLAREEGKTIGEATAEVVRAGQILQFFAGEALRMAGERRPSTREGVIVDVVREPVGVVVAITPWNFPIAIPAWKIAPALAYGNTVVLKPAELVVGSAAVLAGALEHAGLPPGVLNLLIGSGGELGPVLANDPRVDAITFTGSQIVGTDVLRDGAAHLARVQLEMGGKNPLIIAADADLDTAVDVAIQGAFFSTGQRCTASSRIIVVDAIRDEFIERFVSASVALRVGDALDPATQIGPVVEERQLAIDEEFLAEARTDGAEVHGGERIERSTRGNFLQPAVVLGTAPDDRINREEVFGPVATVLPAADYDEALSLANGTEYGLTSGICTTSLRLAEHFQANSAAGMVTINLPTAGVDPHVPFGGRKRSSFGQREQGADAREFFTITKTAYRAFS